MVHRLCQIFVGAGVEASHDILGIGLCRHQDNGHEGKRSVAFEAAANLDTIEFRHHDIEQNEVWKQCFRRIERLLAIGRLAQLIALRGEPLRKDVTVGFVVVDDQNARWIVHEPCPRSELKVRIDEFWRAVPSGCKALPHRRRSRRRAPWPRRRSMRRR